MKGSSLLPQKFVTPLRSPLDELQATPTLGITPAQRIEKMREWRNTIKRGGDNSKLLGLDVLLMQEELKVKEGDWANKRIGEFNDWLRGKSRYNNDTKLTKWGRRRLVGESIEEYLDQFVERKSEFHLKLAKMKDPLYIPDNIVDAWLYFNLIVIDHKGDKHSDLESWFMYDWGEYFGYYEQKNDIKSQRFGSKQVYDAKLDSNPSSLAYAGQTRKNNIEAPPSQPEAPIIEENVIMADAQTEEENEKEKEKEEKKTTEQTNKELQKKTEENRKEMERLKTTEQKAEGMSRDEINSLIKTMRKERDNVLGNLDTRLYPVRSMSRELIRQTEKLVHDAITEDKEFKWPSEIEQMEKTEIFRVSLSHFILVHIRDLEKALKNKK